VARSAGLPGRPGGLTDLSNQSVQPEHFRKANRKFPEVASRRVLSARKDRATLVPIPPQSIPAVTVPVSVSGWG
jgi:hypothetical protein